MSRTLYFFILFRLKRFESNFACASPFYPIVGNFCPTETYSVRAGDTTFNCFPSLHAAASAICLHAWYLYSRVKPRDATKTVSVVVGVITVGVILSTLFLKQRYIADKIAGIVLACGVGRPLFNRLWKLPVLAEPAGREV